jgi:hypothetical protein
MTAALLLSPPNPLFVAQGFWLEQILAPSSFKCNYSIDLNNCTGGIKSVE